MGAPEDPHQADLERWASEDLALFGARGLDRESDEVGGGAQLLTLADGRGHWVQMQAEVSYLDAQGRRLSVTAHRRDDEQFELLRDYAGAKTFFAARWEATPVDLRRESSRLGFDEPFPDLDWEPVQINIDGDLTSFEVCRFDCGFWFALGRTAEAELTLDSRGIQLAGLQLERLGERVPDRPLEPEWRWKHPGPARVVFPSALRDAPPPDSVEDSALIDLVCRNWTRLEGTIAGSSVELILDETRAAGTANGTIDGEPIEITWTRSYEESETGSTDAVRLLGTFGALAIELHGVFRGSFFFDEGSFDGNLGGEELSAIVERADGGWSSATVAFQGQLAEEELTFCAAVGPGPRGGSVVRGPLGSELVHVDVRESPRGRVRKVCGCWPGSTLSGLLIACSMLFFG
ncbi:MAG: hypothetical protein JWM05_1264 [Acidimicrobiales bacterium]|nr:hypothetical protein [Acidimicrobiales bacterium]